MLQLNCMYAISNLFQLGLALTINFNDPQILLVSKKCEITPQTHIYTHKHTHTQFYSFGAKVLTF